jgi:ribosome maturation factor RimP
MINQAKVTELCETFLKDSENYLIDVKVSPSNRIMIHIGNDNHVSIQDCIALSRFIERSFDRDRDDFELEVSSPGIDQPFKVLRQYLKYVGKAVEVKLNDGTIVKGTLLEADAEKLSLQQEQKKRQKAAKKTAEDDQVLNLLMSDIKETKLKLIF